MTTNAACCCGATFRTQPRISVTTASQQQQASAPVPRRLRHNSRLAPALLAGIAATQLGLLPMPAPPPADAAAAAVAPQIATPAIERRQADAAAAKTATPADIAGARGELLGMLQGLDLTAIKDKLKLGPLDLALAFESFPSTLLQPPQLKAGGAAAGPSTTGPDGSGGAGLGRVAYQKVHTNQHGFCYSRMLCGMQASERGGPAADGA